MRLPDRLRVRVEAMLGCPIDTAERLGGGSIAAVWRVRTAASCDLIVKAGTGLALEAWMLTWLASETQAPVPRVIAAAEDLLVMEHLDGEAGALSTGGERHLGAIVAALHDHGADRFGFPRDTVIGGLPQPNGEEAEWLPFFRDRRLLHMAREALAVGRLPASAMRRVEALATRLDRWIPGGGAPALVHGDLWGGNILARGDRIVGLIDPAIYYGDPEVELAFMTLFGSVGDAFFASYGERRPLRPGFFEERRTLYNLYPLLVHVRLFGGAYLAQLDAGLRHFGC